MSRRVREDTADFSRRRVVVQFGQSSLRMTAVQDNAKEYSNGNEHE